MKKSILFLTFLLSATLSFAQGQSTVLTTQQDGTYTYEHVFNKDGLSQEKIFEAIKSWVVKNIKSQSNTNYFAEDKSSITTNPVFAGDYGNWYDFKLVIDIKDGKYRVSATSFIWHKEPGVSRPLGNFEGLGVFKKAKVKVIENFDGQFKAMLASIEESLNAKSDW